MAQKESNSGVSDVIKQGEQVILEQRKQLEAKAKPKKTAEKQAVDMPGVNIKEETGSKSISEVIKEGEQVILEQKKQLEMKKETEEEIKEKTETKEAQVKVEVYEQQIIQEAANQAPMTTLERQLQRESFRRELMVTAGKEAVVPFRTERKFSLRLSEVYDDNIFLTDTNKKADYITTLSPSVLFSINSKYACGDVNLVMDISEYKTNKKQGGISYLMSTYIRPGTLTLPFFKRRGGKIGYEIQDDFQPFVTTVATSEQTARTDSTYNKFFGTLDYYMSTKRTLALEYTNTFRDYRTQTVRTFSYSQNDIAPTFYFNIRPKWSVFAGYKYTILDYTRGGTDSSTSNSLRTGLTGTLFSKVLTRFEVGKMWRIYEEADNGRTQKIFFQSALSNKFTPSTTGLLEYNHTIEESTYTLNPYYVSDEFRIDLQHKLSYKTMVMFGMGYIHNGYDRVTTEGGVTKKRADAIWQPSVSMKYYFKKWWSADLNYSYANRRSVFETFEYIDNRITGGMNIQF